MSEILENKNGTRKPNCFNCKNLEWGDGDIGDPEGLICTKREYRCYKQEEDHLKLLSSSRYLNNHKSCCDLKLVRSKKC